MPRRDIDSELDAHRDVVEHIRDEEGYADAAETYANCWKLREWQTRLQEPGNADNTMSDFAWYVWDSIEAGTWANEWNGILFRMMRKDMPPQLRARILEGCPLVILGLYICKGLGRTMFTNQELRDLKPRLGDNVTGICWKHPGRHLIDEIPDV